MGRYKKKLDSPEIVDASGYYKRVKARKSHIRKIQKALNLPSSEQDGLFGPITYKAIAEYQKANGLTVDGKAGNNTLRTLQLIKGNEYASSFYGSKEKIEIATPGIQGLLDLIASKESSGNYNAIYRNPGQNERDFTNKTIREILEIQQEYLDNGNGGSAIGKYQIVPDTMKDYTKKHKIDIDNTLFSVSFQEEFALNMLKEKGLQRYISGAIDTDTFLENISGIWAAIPRDESGLSRYNEVGNNKALISYQKIYKQIESIKATS